MRRVPLLLLAVAACGGPSPITETGNPDFDMTYRATSSDPSAVSIDGSPAGKASLEAVRVSIGDVRFVEGEGCDTDAEVEHDAPGIVADLLTMPEPVTFALPATEYCRVRVRFDRSGELGDASIVIEGTRADGVPFTITSDATPEVDLRSRGEPFSLSEAESRLVMALDVGAWLAGIDLAGATVTGGRVTIDDHENEALLEGFDAAVETALGLYDDVDGDGEGDGELAVAE